MILSGFIMISAFWALYYNEPIAIRAILISTIITFVSGFLAFLAVRKYDHRDINKKDGYLIVTLTWIIISVFGSLPFYISGAIPA